MFKKQQHTPPIYTPIYVYRRFFYFASKHLKTSTLQILTIKVHFINVY